MIKSSGYAQTLVVWGIIQGVIGILAAQGLRMPPENYQARERGARRRDRRAADPAQLFAARDAARARSSICCS